ncbi:MAG: ThuA domain-containing protein [Opitutaceae bacterium]
MNTLISLPRLSRMRSLPAFSKILSAVSLLGVLSFANLGSAQIAATAPAKKILFLSGPKDHGAPGRHEYVLDLKTLAESFDKATNLKGVTTQHLVGKAPTDMAAYKDVAVIVIESSSDRLEEETHPLFPPDPRLKGKQYDPETTAFLRALNAQIKANKIGVVFIHYANWTENSAARALYFEWTGGLWVNSVSRNPVEQWTMTPDPEAKGHPIWNGVKPWTTPEDEVFCRFMLPVDKRRTNLLVASPHVDRQRVGAQVSSFAYQRDDGGRGFVFGGQDHRKNLALDDHRRFLLNGIAWAANIEIPAEGILSPAPDVSDMTPGLPGVGGRGAGRGPAPVTPGTPAIPPAKTN